MREVENSKTDRITREGDKRNRSPPPKYIIRELALFRPEPTHTQRYGRVEAEVERYCGVAAARYYATSILAFISREGERARERAVSREREETSSSRGIVYRHILWKEAYTS